MNLDQRLAQGRRTLEWASAAAQPDPADLDARVSRSRTRRTVLSGLVTLVVVVGGFWLLGSARNESRSTATAGAAAQVQNDPPNAQDLVAPVLIDRAAFVLDDEGQFEQTLPTAIDEQPGSAFAGEEFAEVHVRFGNGDEGDRHQGELLGTIRVGVGSYDESIREVFAGSGEVVTVGSRLFEAITVERATFEQLALVPVNLRERTILLSGRGASLEDLIAMAETIDLSENIPQIGPHPDGFSVLHSGRAEFSTLDDGTSVSYRGADEGTLITVTTYEASISCFAYAWVHPNTELVAIDRDIGVLSQLSGAPGEIGTYNALWNVDGDTLIGVVAHGVDREGLIDIGDNLVLDQNPRFGYRSSLPFDV